MYATYATDYDLAVAADRLRDLQEQMKAVRVAQVVRPETKDRPSLLDRLFSLAGRGAQIQTPKGEVGAAA
jgi:hypothetical protein